MSEALHALRELESTYQPSDKTAEAICDKHLIAVIGAFAVGKSTLIDAVATIHPKYTEVISFTTRPSRGAGDKYRFLDHSEENLEILMQKAQTGSLINLAVHPTTGYVYGTEADDYRSQNCMLTTTAQSYESDKTLPFKTVRPIVVVTEPEIWRRRINARDMSSPEKHARMAEARQSLEWSLDTSETLFIDNSTAPIAKTADMFVRLLEGNVEHLQNVRHIAVAMLRSCSD